MCNLFDFQLYILEKNKKMDISTISILYVTGMFEDRVYLQTCHRPNYTRSNYIYYAIR